jgi:hypothetical protein
VQGGLAPRARGRPGAQGASSRVVRVRGGGRPRTCFVVRVRRCGRGAGGEGARAGCPAPSSLNTQPPIPPPCMADCSNPLGPVSSGAGRHRISHAPREALITRSVIRLRRPMAGPHFACGEGFGMKWERGGPGILRGARTEFPARRALHPTPCPLSTMWGGGRRNACRGPCLHESGHHERRTARGEPVVNAGPGGQTAKPRGGASSEAGSV